MKQHDLDSHPGWSDCTFEGSRRQVLRLGLKTSFREKLQWLEEAGRLAERFGPPPSASADHGTTDDRSKTDGRGLRTAAGKS